jgi:hypothetical protein
MTESTGPVSDGEWYVDGRTLAYTPVELPLRRRTPERLLAVELVHQIPYGWWTLFEEASKAYNLIVIRHELGFAKHNAHTFAMLLDDVDLRLSGEIADWTVPWHRLRDKDGLCRAKHRGKVYDPNDLGNLRLKHEYPKFYGASAPPARHFYIDQAVRRGEIDLGG